MELLMRVRLPPLERMSNLNWIIPFHWHGGQLRPIEQGMRRILWPTLKAYEPGSWLSTPAVLRATKITSEKGLVSLDLAELDAEQRQPMLDRPPISHQFYGTAEIDVVIAPNTMFRVVPVRLYMGSPDPLNVYLHLSAMLEKPILSSV